jgi:hypothetical protein
MSLLFNILELIPPNIVFQITEAVTEPVATRPTPSSNIPKSIFSKSISPISTSPIPNIRNEIEEILGPVRLVTPHNDYLALESGYTFHSHLYYGFKEYNKSIVYIKV